VEAAEDFAKHMKHIHEEAQVALSKAQDKMKHYPDQHWGNILEYQVGQKVWIHQWFCITGSWVVEGRY